MITRRSAARDEESLLVIGSEELEDTRVELERRRLALGDGRGHGGADVHQRALIGEREGKTDFSSFEHRRIAG